MAVPTRPASAAQFITIGEQTYTLTFSVVAMAALQDHYGLKSLTEVGEKLRGMTNATLEDMVVMFWAALRRYHRDLTLDDAWSLADDAGPQMLAQALIKAAAGATPPPGKGKAGAAAAARPTTGRSTKS